MIYYFPTGKPQQSITNTQPSQPSQPGQTAWPAEPPAKPAWTSSLASKASSPGYFLEKAIKKKRSQIHKRLIFIVNIRVWAPKKENLT